MLNFLSNCKTVNIVKLFSFIKPFTLQLVATNLHSYVFISVCMAIAMWLQNNDMCTCYITSYIYHLSCSCIYAWVGMHLSQCVNISTSVLTYQTTVSYITSHYKYSWLYLTTVANMYVGLDKVSGELRLCCHTFRINLLNNNRPVNMHAHFMIINYIT